MRQTMLTTYDNPFDPFTDFDSWFAYDATSGYHTPSFLARITTSSFDLPELEQAQAIEDAIDEIVSENVLGLYRKVSREIEDEFAEELFLE